MADKIFIRPHINRDIEQISLIEQECFSQPWSKDALEEFADGAFSGIITAEFNDTVAGYITYTQICDEIQIANVAVSSKFRRQKIATHLIKHLINKGLEDNIEIITLEVRFSNIGAISLYENCGFEKVGTRKNFYSHPTEDALLMNYNYPSRKE